MLGVEGVKQEDRDRVLNLCRKSRLLHSRFGETKQENP